MPDENTTTETTSTTEGTEETTAQEQSTEETTSTEGGSTEEKNPLDELPEWAQKELKKARGEAARYRTSLRDAETKLSEAKTPEEFEAARAELAQENAKLQAELTRSNLVSQYDLPKGLSTLLQGSPEEMEQQAKALSEHVASSAPDPTSLKGGLTPGGDEDDEGDDPVAAVRRARNRGY